MQKKLYFLNEEEKNRILNLHESRTKSQYLLSEQTTDADNALITFKDMLNKYKIGKKPAYELLTTFPTSYAETFYKNLPDKTKETIKTWTKIPCVSNSLNVTPIMLSDNTIAFKGGGFTWYGNFRKADEKGNMSSYACSADGSKTIDAPQGGGYQKVAGGNVLPQVVTPDVVKQLRTMGGLTDTAATLTQKDINDLYALFFNNLPKK
jgi:hypothetical protein